MRKRNPVGQKHFFLQDPYVEIFEEKYKGLLFIQSGLGITLLHRIGTGMFFSTMSMIAAALTKIRRIKVAKDNGLIDMPHATIPLSISLLLPQYMLFGIADVFVMVGMQEFFYDQMPDTMKILSIAVSLSVLGVGNFLSSILISVTEKLSCRNKGSCWFVDNLNKAHLEDHISWHSVRR